MNGVLSMPCIETCLPSNGTAHTARRTNEKNIHKHLTISKSKCDKYLYLFVLACLVYN